MDKCLGKKRWGLWPVIILIMAAVMWWAVVPDRTAGAAEPIKIGMVGLFSGRMAMAGESCLNGIKLALDEINAQGGVLGRKIEVIHRDSAGKIEEAVRHARDLVVKDKVDFLYDGGSSRESFAVKEVSRDLKILTIILSETTSNTADPKIWTKYSFRASRIDAHDGVAGGIYAAEMSKKLGLKRWASISPDYAYGRDSTEMFFWALKKFNPDIQIVNQYWPKIFAPDYTAHITALQRDKADAFYSALWGGDLTAFVEQARLYGLFKQTKFFCVNLADYTVLKPMKEVPEGLYSGSRYLKEAPPTPANAKFADDYLKKFGDLPTNWSQEAYTGIHMLAEAIKKAGTLETDAVIKAFEGLTMKLPWGSPPEGTVTMRARDHQIIDYAIGWGPTISKPPYVVDLKFVSWDTILKYEEIWLKEQGWLK